MRPARGTLLEFRGPVVTGQELFPCAWASPSSSSFSMIVVLIFGASRLPELGRGIGKGIKNFKDATKDGNKSEQG